jgi:hypothetical protein
MQPENLSAYPGHTRPTYRKQLKAAVASQTDQPAGFAELAGVLEEIDTTKDSDAFLKKKAVSLIGDLKDKPEIDENQLEEIQTKLKKHLNE